MAGLSKLYAGEEDPPRPRLLEAYVPALPLLSGVIFIAGLFIREEEGGGGSAGLGRLLEAAGRLCGREEPLIIGALGVLEGCAGECSLPEAGVRLLLLEGEGLDFPRSLINLR